MGRMTGVFDNPPGFPCTPPGVDIVEGGKLTSNNVAGSSHDPLQSPAVASGAVSKPGGDTAGQDALHSAGQIKSNQIKSLLLSHHHSTSALVSEILMSVLQTAQKTTIYIWTVHIYRLYRRQCAKYTYIYSVHIVYYKDILNYQLHIIHRMGASTLCTLSIHYVVYT